AFLALQKEQGSFDKWLWRFVGGKPKVNAPKGRGDLPASSRESDELSKALKAAGFTFVGTTICYAFMQAVGMVNDHIVTCSFRFPSRKGKVL
ncbi:MAG TPA: DNA-3-methyladenine glycosylase I, partial [Candidatus Eremiobacteraceae bacterium]|nr:DNA-3-methyladenine glycosylase I [Candidatus Eremiobacteraceae bacterium]